MALALAATLTAAPFSARAQPLVADTNCDGSGSAADFTAAVIVSGDGTQFPECEDADPYRDHRLVDSEFLPLLHDLFDTFAIPFTPTPSASPTVTATPTLTATKAQPTPPTASPTPSSTATPTDTPTPLPTFTRTNTSTPPATSTRTHIRTFTPTPTASPTRTPTGLAPKLAGVWSANWQGTICYLAGSPYGSLVDTSYRVTAIDGRLDIEIVGGERIGRGLAVSADGMVQTTFRTGSGNICRFTGVEEELAFDYTFTLRTNGTGSAAAHWTYGFNTNCAVCEVVDATTLVRTGP